MSALEERRRALLSTLGVSDECVKESTLAPLPAPSGADTIRVAQFNLLADGLSNDGFLVRPVLADWPAGPGRVPTASGSSVEFLELTREMLAAQGNGEALDGLKETYDVPAAQHNFDAVANWQGRLLQIQRFVESCDPDVLVVEELDHYDQLSSALAELGYSSRLAGAAEYKPAHLEGFCDRNAEGAARFCAEWSSRGHAFLPHLGSSCMQIALQKSGLADKMIAAADEDLKAKLVDPARGGLNRFWAQSVPSTGPLLKAAGLEDPSSVDDMGVAVFWRSARFDATGLSIRTYPKGGSGMVQVQLKEKGEGGCSFVVLGTHLVSGDAAVDEDKRLTQVNCDGGLCATIAEAQGSGNAVLLCMDANSHPQIVGSDGTSSCWRALRGALGASIWDPHFDASGAAIGGGDGLDPPVTSNKVRGPLSGQARKIGKHAYYNIDHIFFDPAAFELKSHVYGPIRFPSAAAALESVQPSLANPSDHYPVVVDMVWKKSAA